MNNTFKFTLIAFSGSPRSLCSLAMTIYATPALSLLKGIFGIFVIFVIIPRVMPAKAGTQRLYT